jgi:hypothetical protein
MNDGFGPSFLVFPDKKGLKIYSSYAIVGSIVRQKQTGKIMTDQLTSERPDLEGKEGEGKEGFTSADVAAHLADQEPAPSISPVELGPKQELNGDYLRAVSGRVREFATDRMEQPDFSEADFRGLVTMAGKMTGLAAGLMRDSENQLPTGAHPDVQTRAIRAAYAAELMTGYDHPVDTGYAHLDEILEAVEDSIGTFYIYPSRENQAYAGRIAQETAGIVRRFSDVEPGHFDHTDDKARLSSFGEVEKLMQKPTAAAGPEQSAN